MSQNSGTDPQVAEDPTLPTSLMVVDVPADGHVSLEAVKAVLKTHAKAK
jgi:hypothetical protein